jgi:hypothetical protein
MTNRVFIVALVALAGLASTAIIWTATLLSETTP